MKKIGILTFHTADNYGAVLQAYALQQFISKHLEQDVEIINFSTPLLENEYQIIHLSSRNPIKDAVLKFINLLFYPSLKRKKNRFHDFRKDMLTLSQRKYVSPDDLKNNIYPYDVYITGSDQVFNPNINYSDIYYLNFNKEGGKKIAYAPSFGVSVFTDEITQRIKPYLLDFDALSCRENAGAEYLSQILCSEIPCVADPVYLLSKEDWLKLVSKPKEKNRFIFVYDLNGGKNLIEIAKKVGKECNLPIICCTGHITQIYKGVKCKYDLGPKELLGYIANAEYVVTDSFHGTSLSLVLGVKVISYIATKHTSSRIISIMEKLNITDQLMYNSSQVDLNKISWFNYDDILLSYRQKSMDYLRNAIEK